MVSRGLWALNEKLRFDFAHRRRFDGERGAAILRGIRWYVAPGVFTKRRVRTVGAALRT